MVMQPKRSPSAKKPTKRPVKRTVRKTTGKTVSKTASRTKRSARQQRYQLNISLSPRVLNGLMVGAALMILVGAAMWLSSWLNNPQNLRIGQIDWQGEFNYLDETELKALAAPYTETNLYLLDAEGLETELEAHPWVRAVSLRKAWPDQLIVNIEEEFPVAFWGQDKLLNQFGEIFPAQLPGKTGVFPLIHSPENNGREMAERYVELMDALKGLGLDIVELTENDSGSWQMKFREGQEVIIGRKEQKKRIMRFKVGYMQELRAKFNAVSKIDLRYTNGFAVEWKQGAGKAGPDGPLGSSQPEIIGSG